MYVYHDSCLMILHLERSSKLLAYVLPTVFHIWISPLSFGWLGWVSYLRLVLCIRSFAHQLKWFWLDFFFPVWSELVYECWNSSAWWVNSRKSSEYVQLKCLYIQLKAAGSHVADESRHTDGKYVMSERLNCWLASQLWW